MKAPKTEKAVFGAGCFWGVEYSFSKLSGVVNTTVGYSGGDFENPTYEDVCGKKTNHAEVVLVEYDPKKITYEKLLEEFFSMHDPTQKNRQGPDFGTQYRSIILYMDKKQKIASENFIKALQKNSSKKIETEITPFEKFYKAEEYHQRYMEKNGRVFCH